LRLLRTSAVTALAIAAAALTASSALAEPPTVQTDVNHDYNEVSYGNGLPCIGDTPGIVTFAGTFVTHSVSRPADGDSQFHANLNGIVTYQPDADFDQVPDEGGTTFTGPIRTQTTASVRNGQSGTSTSSFSSQLKGSDGSSVTIRGVVRYTINANGEITVNFDKTTCG
jgi:hypothetical protein